MKLLLSALCAAIITAPLAFADCSKCKDKDKKEETVLLAEKCKKGEECDKDEAALLAGKCKKGEECDKDEATVLA